MAKDRTNMARVGLTLLAIALLLGRSPFGLVAIAVAVFLPVFRVLGWWLTVVMVVAVSAIAAGGVISSWRNWDQIYAESGPAARWWLGSMVGSLVACGVALYGLTAKGTRSRVEARTVEVAPEAFVEEK